LQPRQQLLAEAPLQPRDLFGLGRHGYRSAPHFRHVRIFLPSSVTRWPTLVGCPHVLHTSCTFEMSMNSSRSMMPACCSCEPLRDRLPVARWCRFERATPSTITRPSFGSTFTTRPVRPRSLPLITLTSSSFLISTPGIHST